MKKGFTLIELLAVIVILAIIALIATPIILGIINDAREQSKKRTAELIAKEVELAYTSYLFKANGVGDPDKFCSYMTNDYFAMDNGEIVTEGEQASGCATDKKVTIKSGNDTYTVNYDSGTVKVLYRTEEYAQVILKGGTSSTYTQVYKPQYYGDYSFFGTVDDIAPTSPSTEPPTDQAVYIGYDVSAGKISSGYVCFKKNGNEYCLKGYNTDAYTTNVEIIKNAYKEVVDTDSCSFADDNSYCRTDVHDVHVGASLNGIVGADGDHLSCRVFDYGFECYES